MNTSRYAVSAPKREALDAPKMPEYCDVADCTSYYPGDGKPGLRGKADVFVKAFDGTLSGRCCYHYDRELYRARLGRHSPIMHGAIDLTMQMVRDHWATLDEAEVAKAAKRAKQIELRRNPVKPYTEVGA